VRRHGVRADQQELDVSRDERRAELAEFVRKRQGLVV
jgi:hypothetical protein